MKFVVDNDLSEKERKKLLVKYLRDIITKDTMFCCIGTDRSLNDLIGPLIGTKLEKKFKNKFNNKIVGTLKTPLHALNIKKFHEDNTHEDILSIDACLGVNYDFRTIIVRKDEGINPGSAMGKDLPMIGNKCIKIIIGTDFFDRQNRFYDIDCLAELIVDSIYKVVKDLYK